MYKFLFDARFLSVSLTPPLRPLTTKGGQAKNAKRKRKQHRTRLCITKPCWLVLCLFVTHFEVNPGSVDMHGGVQLATSERGHKQFNSIMKQSSMKINTKAKKQKKEEEAAFCFTCLICGTLSGLPIHR